VARSVIGDILGDVFGGAELRLRRVDRAVTNATDSVEERIYRLAAKGLSAGATVLRILALLAAVQTGQGVATLFVAAFIPLTIFRAVAKQNRRSGSRVTWIYQSLCVLGTIGVLIGAYLRGGQWGVVILAGCGEVVAWLARRTEERADDIEREKIRRAFEQQVLKR
jgi:hypothetical protein